MQRRTRCSLATSRHGRSEEHTSELQSRRDLVCRLRLEKKKTTSTSHQKSDIAVDGLKRPEDERLTKAVGARRRTGREIGAYSRCRAYMDSAPAASSIDS